MDNNRPILPSGAGYVFNKKAWTEAANEGLDHKIMRRLEFYERPVTLHELWERLTTVDPMPYTEQEVQESLMRLIEKKEVQTAYDGYILTDNLNAGRRHE